MYKLYFFIILCAFLLSVTAIAQVPQIITYQGFLTQDGVPVNETLPMIFVIYDAPVGGTIIKQNSFPNPLGVSIVNGVYSVKLDVSGVVFDKPYYLQIVVNGQGQSPRLALTSAPYSLGPWSTSVTSGERKLENITTGEVIYYNNGNVGIGTSTPTEQLEITGNFRLPPSTSTVGVIKSGNDRFIHNYGGASNFFGGVNSGNFSTTGLRNIGIGFSNLSNNTSGNSNTAVGYSTLVQNTEGMQNTAIGMEALYFNTTGGNNTASGERALRGNTTGNFNTANGVQALVSNTEGDFNTANGFGALSNNITGNDNVANGAGALGGNATGSYNTANGNTALAANTTGSLNTANGFGALGGHITGSSNTAVGTNAGHNNVTGSGNVFLGNNAGSNETGDNKLYIANSSVDPPLIYGDFTSTRIGLGTTTPAEKLDVAGTIQMTGFKMPTGVTSGYVLTANASGGGTWQPASSAWNLTGNAGTTAGTNFIGTTDNQGLDIRTNNVLRARITTKGQIETYNTGSSVFVGEGAGANDDLTYNGNVFVGHSAGFSNTTGGSNIAIGMLTLRSNTTGWNNTASGTEALYSNTTGIRNTATGWNALHSNTTGGSNIAMGDLALYSNTTASNNTAIGEQALYSNTTGNNNTAIGTLALYSNTIGGENTASGHRALYSNTTGAMNTASGRYALHSNTIGNDNTAYGSGALQTNIDGNYNTACGKSTLSSNANGSENTAIGYEALRNNTGASYNTATGKAALLSNTDGEYNTANGWQALYSNTEGEANTANGVNALNSNTTGSFNTANGLDALNNNSTGGSNTAIGASALLTNTSGENNTAVGSGAGWNNVTGSRNVFLGFYAGYNETGSDNLYIANSSANPPLIYGDFAIKRIGIDLKDPTEKLDVNGTARLRSMPTGTGTTVVVDTSGVLRKQSSSKRYKTKIRPLEVERNKVLQLEPVRFQWKTTQQEDVGLIAEDVDRVIKDLVIYDNENRPDGVKYDRVAIYLLEVVKEQQKKIEEQQKQNEHLSERLAKMEATVKSLVENANSSIGNKSLGELQQTDVNH